MSTTRGSGKETQEEVWEPAKGGSVGLSYKESSEENMMSPTHSLPMSGTYKIIRSAPTWKNN